MCSCAIFQFDNTAKTISEYFVSAILQCGTEVLEQGITTGAE